MTFPTDSATHTQSSSVCEGVSSCVSQWTQLGPAASSPPHVLAAEMFSGCWKAGCRSSRSLAAFELLKGNKAEHKGTSYYHYPGYSLTSPESRELLLLESMFSKSPIAVLSSETLNEKLTTVLFHPLSKSETLLSLFYINLDVLLMTINFASRTVISRTTCLTGCCNHHFIYDLMSTVRRSDVPAMKEKMASPVGGAGGGEKVNDRGRVDGPSCCQDRGRVCCCWVPLELFQALFLQLFFRTENKAK